MEPFITRALAAGIGVAIVAGPLGCFVVWRRMAYFGDSMAHTALLGVALGALLGWGNNLGVILVFLAVSFILAYLQKRQDFSMDTMLGIMSHTALSLGLVAVGFSPEVRIDLMSYLFGDILAVSWTDLVWIFSFAVGVILLLSYFWNSFLLVTINEESSYAEGIPVDRLRFLFILMIAATTLTSMKVVGILLISALLIIPASTARIFARTPEGMAILSAALGTVAIAGGLALSYYLDTPSGPSVVIVSALLFVGAQFWRMIYGR
ncbi:MAG: metal ABC transporter permease [Deltaproteobacteria bacterium]|nr:metal ABC transporter permease [Deltaproteobacteria bacterium]